MDEDKDHDAEVKEQVYCMLFVPSVLGLVACVTTCKQTISFTPLAKKLTSTTRYYRSLEKLRNPDL